MRTLLKRISFLVFIFFLSNFSLKAQGLYLSSGLNITQYDFKSTDNLPLEFNSKTSQFYELGYTFKLKNERLQYGLGLALNRFNSSAGDSANGYEWETTYMGLNNHFQYVIFPNIIKKMSLNAGLQMQVMHIINGEQKINTETFDLTKESEFKGLWLQPGFITTAKYFITEDIQLSLGYNYSVGFNLSNNTDEKLKFNNQQIRFGLHFNIN